MQKIRWYVLVSGRVQDVGFRFFSLCLALLGGLTGWVRNRPDGRVELEIQGPQDRVNTFLRRMKKGTRRVQVETVETEPRETLPNEKHFIVRYDDI